MDHISKFENALIDLIYMHMEDGLTGAEVMNVLLTRAGDDFDACHAELTKTIGGPQVEAVKRFAKMGA